MDESDSERRDDVLNFLSELSGRKSVCTIEVLIASRPEADVRPWMDRARHSFLEEEKSKDIRPAVRQRIDNLEQLRTRTYSVQDPVFDIVGDNNDFKEIEAYILDNAVGVFLWVRLILRELEICIRDGGYSLSDLDDLVRSFPKGLAGRDGFYGLMIKRLKARQGGN